MQQRLFGTDGIREIAGRGALAVENVRRLGRAIGRAACAHRGGPGARAARALIGRDPRPSGPELVRALAAGLAEAGVRAADAGAIPTPAVSLLARAEGYDLGLVVSASHNPPEYNGIKVFEADGTKASDEL